MNLLFSLVIISNIGFSFDQNSNHKEAEVVIQTDLGKLQGTLIEGTNKEVAIIIIAGSGPTDRNGNSAMGMTNNSLKMLAESISEKGFSTLRYDKRIFSEDPKAMIPESDLRFERFVDDAGYAVDFLSKLGYKKIVIAGHSQGSLVALLAALNDIRVASVISLSGSSVSADQLVLEQIAKQAPILVDPLKIKLDSLKQGYKVSVDNPFLQPLLRIEIQDFLRSYIMYDPIEIISQLEIPTLIINGTTDLQCAPKEAEALKAGAKNGRLIIIENMNHILKSAPADFQSNMMTYNDPSLPLAQGLIDPIIDFLSGL